MSLYFIKIPCTKLGLISQLVFISQDQEQSDSDYEEPDNNIREDNYICADDCKLDEDSGDDYEPPPALQSSDIPSHLRVAQPLGDGDYLGNP